MQLENIKKKIKLALDSNFRKALTMQIKQFVA